MTSEGREATARLIGVALALSAMAIGWYLIRWPAPGIAVGIGIGAYLLARGRRN